MKAPAIVRRILEAKPQPRIIEISAQIVDVKLCGPHLTGVTAGERRQVTQCADVESAAVGTHRIQISTGVAPGIDLRHSADDRVAFPARRIAIDVPALQVSGSRREQRSRYSAGHTERQQQSATSESPCMVACLFHENSSVDCASPARRTRSVE